MSTRLQRALAGACALLWLLVVSWCIGHWETSFEARDWLSAAGPAAALSVMYCWALSRPERRNG